MFKLCDGFTDIRFEELPNGALPVFEGASERLVIPMSRIMSPDAAKGVVLQESFTPKPKSFLFVCWRRVGSNVQVGFSCDRVFVTKDKATPDWM